MKFSLSWLKAHLDTDASAEAIADRLTDIGLEVEELSYPAEPLAPFRVAKVLTAEKHPQADKLQVLTVDAGEGPVQVVCGAPNARAGMLGVFGPPGAYVPGSDMVLKVAAIRGVESRGMMCSVRELQLATSMKGSSSFRTTPRSAPPSPNMRSSTTRFSISRSRPTARTAWGSAGSRATWPPPGWAH